eukprot:2118843-Prymnesium_polylepis.1
MRSTACAEGRACGSSERQLLRASVHRLRSRPNGSKLLVARLGTIHSSTKLAISPSHPGSEVTPGQSKGSGDPNCSKIVRS